MHIDPSALTLPSSWRLAQLLDQVTAATDGLGTLEAAALLDALGDLSLALARRPASAWAATPAVMASHLSAAGWSDGGAVVDAAVARGLWVVLPGGVVRPAGRELAHTLAARRMASTEDTAGDLDHRLRGDLLDVVPMAIALVEDPEGQADLMQLLSERDGPFEDVLELGALQLALALAWGATCAPDLRRALLDRALSWTNHGADDLHGVAGMAALAQEVRGGPFAQEVAEALTDRIESLLGRQDPGATSCLEASLGSLAAQYEGSAPTLRAFALSCGFSAGQVGSLLPMVWPAGPALDRALLSLAQQSKEGDPTAPGALACLGAPSAVAEGLVQGVLKVARDRPSDPLALQAAAEAAGAVARWPAVGELTAHLLARLTLAPVDNFLRATCARALAAHPQVAAAVRGSLLPALDAALGRPDERYAATYALLALGTDDPGVASMAVGLAADGEPVAPLSEALDGALRTHPGLVLGLREVWREGEVALHLATLELLEPLARRLEMDEERGAFVDAPPLAHRARMELLEMVLPLCGALDDPDLAGLAAVVAGWLGRRDPDVIATLHAVRDAVDARANVDLRGSLDLALGGAAPDDPASIRCVAEDAAHGPPDLAIAAAFALPAMLTHRDAADPLEDLIPTLRARLDYEGPQQGPLRDLLIALATLPVLPAP